MIAVILWLVYGLGISGLLRLMGANDTLYPYALASVLGMVIQLLVLGSHFISPKNQLRLIRPKHVFSSIGRIIGNGIPSFFNEFANGFIVLLFNIQILKYCGESALSVYSVISNFVILCNSLFTGGWTVHSASHCDGFWRWKVGANQKYKKYGICYDYSYGNDFFCLRHFIAKGHLFYIYDDE